MHQILTAAPDFARADNLRGLADLNRVRFDRWGITCIALLGRPGVGKTALLDRTLAALNDRLQVATIVGEPICEREADRWRLQGIPTLAPRTGSTEGLNPRTVAESLDRFQNQYTPSHFDLVWLEKNLDSADSNLTAVGEHLKVALLDATRGEDLIVDCPLLFREANCVLLTKIDRVSDEGANIEGAIANLRQIDSKIPILPISTQTGVGLEAWLNWVRLQVALRNQSDKAARQETIGFGRGSRTQ